MSLDEELRGKYVHVEAQLLSGSGSKRTLLYSGEYEGIEMLGNREWLVLKDGQHFTAADVRWDWKGKEDKTRIKAHTTYIRLDDVISIDIPISQKEWDEYLTNKKDGD